MCTLTLSIVHCNQYICSILSHIIQKLLINAFTILFITIIISKLLYIPKELIKSSFIYIIMIWLPYFTTVNILKGYNIEFHIMIYIISLLLFVCLSAIPLSYIDLYIHKRQVTALIAALAH